MRCRGHRMVADQKLQFWCYVRGFWWRAYANWSIQSHANVKRFLPPNSIYCQVYNYAGKHQLDVTLA